MKHFHNDYFLEMNDSAVITADCSCFAFTTDSHVVKPIFFPGGDIGKLAVAGTVNDLAVSGAIPKYLSCGFIIEEDFEIKKLEQIAISMKNTASLAGVKIIAGDTKVVGKGEADGVFINTSGIGFMPDGVDFSTKNIKPGDKVILSGNIGEHAVAILLARENYAINSDIISDCNPVNSMTQELIQRFSSIRIMRDPTRGGVGTVLNEFVENQLYGIRIFENNIPVSDKVVGICEPFGFDPLLMANEGKFLFIISAEDADESLEILKGFKLGKNAQIIGEVIDKPVGKVLMKTRIGVDRIVNSLVGEILPRIC